MTGLQNRLARLWPLLLIVLALAGVYATGLGHDLTWSALAARQQALQAYAADRPYLSAATYTVLYAIAAAVSLPGAAVLTLAGGLVFGVAVGAACTVVGATVGATALFLAARHASDLWAANRAGTLPDRVRTGLERDGLSYLLALRLLPLVPFWLVNLAAGLVGMRPRTFVLGTFIGIIPGTLVFASIGAGLSGVVAAGHTPDLAVVLQPAVLLPLLGLAVLSLLPVAWRHWRARHG